MPLDQETLQAIETAVRKATGARPDKPRFRKNGNRALLCVTLSQEEMNALDAAAFAQSLCRSDLVRNAISAVIGRVIETKRKIPHGFRYQRNQKKSAHYRDGAIDEHAREEAGRRAKALSDERYRVLAAANQVTITPAIGMLSETALAGAAPKLGRG